MWSDLVFYSAGLYILGLVLLFSSYDILLRLIHGRRSIGLIFSLIFLLLMGSFLLVLSVLVLSRLYILSKSLFTITAIAFFLFGLGTIQLTRWKRQIMKVNHNHE
jgi:hypothetical protein